jgi:hypothetical protein
VTFKNRAPRRNCSDMDALILENIRLARELWGLSAVQRAALKALTRKFRLSITLGDLRLLDASWYVTHSGLTRLANRSHCAGIDVRSMREYCDPVSSRWVFKATVYKSHGSRGFVGHGDADPSNTSALVRGAEMRVAETRAVNRALRKAYGIGICSVEELGYLFSPPERIQGKGIDSSRPNGNGSDTGQPRLRDKLCLLIRKYELDPTLVKRYAADFCGTEALRDASRDLVETFISRLAEEAAKDHAALVCKLNSYNQLEEVKS